MSPSELRTLDRALPRGRAAATSIPALARALRWDERQVREGIERLVGEGLTKNAIATQLHTSWETITKVCRERGLTPVRGHRGKPLTIKARRKPTEPTPPTVIDKVQAMRAKRRAGAEIDALAIEFNCLPSTVRMLCDGVEPAAPELPEEPVAIPATGEEDPAAQDLAVPDIADARELVSARERAYQDKFAEMAVAALTGETPDLSLARLAYEYGFAVGGYRVLAAMAEGEVDAAPSGEAA